MKWEYDKTGIVLAGVIGSVLGIVVGATSGIQLYCHGTPYSSQQQVIPKDEYSNPLETTYDDLKYDYAFLNDL